LPSIETGRVAEALVEVFCRVGFPREILMDRGAQFTSGVMAEMSRLISVKQLMTTPYHPMCNGLVERFNGTLKLMLKRLCAEVDRNSGSDFSLVHNSFKYRHGTPNWPTIQQLKR
jgi:transposase InsO family protein